MHVDLVLGALCRRIHDESDLPLVGDVTPGCVPGEGPDSGRPTWVLDAGDPDSRQREPVHEVSRAAAHLDVADGDAVLGFHPDVCRPGAGQISAAGASHWRAARPTVVGTRRIDTL